MKYLLLLCFISISIKAQVSCIVTFRIEANNIPDSARVYITGNMKEMGNWHPGEVSLINTSGHYWEKTFSLPEGKEIEYKITLGSWNTEAVKNNGDIPKNSRLVVTKDSTINLVINSWKYQFKYKLKGQVTGRLDHYKNLIGEGILPRDILIWLPPDYEKDTTQRYPVLYMQDGQNLFDPATAAFGVDWQLDETADSLIGKGLMRPVIIVGITNTKWRLPEYGDNDTGRAYMKFIVNKVKPFIDSTYRTLSDPENTAAGGSSLGALISFMLGWKYPDIFSEVICMSPTLKVKNIDYVKNVSEYKGALKKLKFYFDAGLNSSDSLLVPGTKQIIEALKDQGYIMGKDILWYGDETGLHNEASWAKRVWQPLLFFFGNNN